MSLDDKIKEALKMDDTAVDMILKKEDGLFSQLLGIFQGRMMMWNILGLILAVLMTVIMTFTGYYFFVSESLDERIFWGTISLALWTGTIGVKVWFWLEMNRNSTNREMKRLELAIAKLTIKLEQD